MSFGIVKPDYNIQIGVKDGKIVCVDWSEIAEELVDFDLTSKQILKTIKDYLKQAIKFIK